MDKEIKIMVMKLFYELKSVIKVQRTLRKKYKSNASNWLWDAIKRVINKFESEGSVDDKKAPSKKQHLSIPVLNFNFFIHDCT